MDASNLLKPGLASGELRCIGSTTFQDYKETFERDHALARRFQKIEIHEPTVEDTVKILRGLKKVYEEHHGVVYTPRALRAAAELSAKHINDRQLPDKAIDVLDEAGARDRMRAARSAATAGSPRRDVERVVAKIAKIPERTVSADDQAALREPRARAEEGHLRAGRGHRGHRLRHQALPLRPRLAREAHRQLPLLRPHRRRARPSSRSSSPASSGSSSCAST